MLPLSYSWLPIAVDVSLKSLLVALVAGLAMAVLRVRDTNVRHRVWTGVLAGMLAMPLLVVLTRNVAPTVPLPGWMTVAWQVPSPEPESAATVRAVPCLEETAAREVDTLGGTFESDEALFAEDFGGPHDFARAAEVAPHVPLPEETAAAVESAPIVSESPPQAESARQSDLTPPPWIAAHWPVLLLSAYVAVAAALLLRLTVGLVLTYRLVRGSRSVDPYASGSFEGGPNVRLLEHPQVFVPLTVGFFRSVILLPAAWRGWSREKLHAVLAHELAHVRRADWLVALVAELNRALYWFHPLAWFLRRRLATLAEQNCDDAVLEAHGDRAQYARYLLEVAAALAASGRRAHAPLQTTAMARVPSVETRIDAILDPGRPLARKLGAIGIACLLAVGIPAVILAAALQPASERNRPESPAAAETPAAATEPESPPNASVETDSAQPSEDGSIKHITGRVLGPDGGPLAGVTVYAAWTFVENAPYDYSHELLGETKTDAAGGFKLTFSAERPESNLPGNGWKIVAFADGFGPAWIRDVNLRENPSPTLKLTPDEPIRGRVLDLEGEPLAGVRVRVRRLYPSDGEEAIAEWINEAAGKPVPPALDDFFRSSGGQFAPRFPTTRNDGRLMHGEPGISQDVASDGDGRFQLQGLGATRLALLEIEGPSVAKTILHVVTRRMEAVSAQPIEMIGVRSPTYFGADFEYVAEPTQAVVGTVTDADTGEPLANIEVQLGQFAGNTFSQDGFLAARTDEAGKYRLVGAPQGGGHRLEAVPAIDEPYFPTNKELESASGFKPITCDFQLRRGVWIQGRVTDRETGTPIVNATVQYLPLRSNKHAEDYPNYDSNITGSVPDDRYKTPQDGSFRVLAIPGAGVLSTIVQHYEQEDTYVRVGLNDVPVHLRNEDGQLNTYHPWSVDGFHALRQVDVPETAEEVEIDLQLTRGKTRRVNLVDEVGQPVEGVRALGRAFPSNLESPLEASTVELVGLRPDEERIVVFIHPERRIGKALKLGPGPETVVELQPCAVVRGRAVNENAEPMPDLRVRVNVDSSETRDNWGRTLTISETDEDGRFEVVLPPGLTWRVSHYAPQTGPNFLAKCRPNPGDVIELGNVTHGTKLDLKDMAAMTTMGPPATRTSAAPRQQPDEAGTGQTGAPQAAPQPLVYEGQVMRPDGQPAAGAELFFVYWYSHQDALAERRRVGRTGADGRFRFEITREQFHRTGDSVPPWQWASLAVVKEGYGLAWGHALAYETTGGVLAEMSDPGHPNAGDIERVKAIIKEQGGPLRLPADVPIRGTVVDTEGQPIAGAQVSLLETYTGADDTLDAWLEAAEGPRAAFYSIREKAPKHLYGPIARALLPRVQTDADGDFTIRGVGRERLVRLLIEAPRIEVADVYCRTRPGDPIEIPSGSVGETVVIHGPELTHVAVPSKPVIGVVRDKETGRPLAGVTVRSNRIWMSTAPGKNETAGNDFSRATTDESGRYELAGLPRAEHNPLTFHPPVEMALLPVTAQVDTRGADVEAVDVDAELERGAVVTGRVVDAETGQGVSGRFTYLAADDERNANSPPLPRVGPVREDIRSDMNGHFEMVVPRQSGYLAFNAFDDTYEKKADRPKNASPVGMALTFFYASGPRGPEYHALAKLDLDEDAESHNIELQVSRGRIVTGVIVDPAGNPLAGGHYAGQSESGQWRPISGGKFVVATYDPSRPRRLTFVHRERGLAGTYLLAGEVEEEVRVQLQPWGKLTGRIVDDQENAVPNVLIASGSMGRMMRPLSSPDAQRVGPPVPLPPTESSSSSRIVADEDGRFTIEGLVPGERYDLYGMEQAGFEGRLQGDIAQGVVLEPGQTLDLGDVTPERPDYEALRREAEKRAEEARKARTMQQNTEDTTAPGDEVKSRLDDGAGFQNRQSATDGSNAARAATMATDETEKNATSTAIRVSGKVVKPNGERLQGAKLYWPRTKTPEPIKLDDMYLQQVASSGRDGSFTAELVFPSMPWLREVPLISVADGFGMAWVDVSPKQTSHELTLRMAEEFPISGRILTTEGVPVPNATIGLTSVMADSSGSIDTLLTAWKNEWRSSSMKVDKVLHIGLHLVGEVLGNKPTDQQGRFAFRGLGREQAVWLKVSSPSIANSLAIVITREGFEPGPYNEAALTQAGDRELYRRQTPRLFANHFTLVAEPGKVITGKVTDIDSGEPLEGVVVDTSAGYGDSIMATTDANGKYRLAGVPVHDDDVLISFRKRHTRYLPRTLAVKLTAGLSAMEFDAGLAKGVLLKGRVTETETGKPVSGGIRFAPLEDNAWKEKPGFDNYKRSRVMESVDRDGTFEFVSIPGPGVLLMQAGASGIEIGGLFVKPYRKGRFSKEDREKVRIYVEGESFYTSSNGLEFFQNGMKVVDVPEDVEEYTVDLTVDRGVDADVAILDDQGQPLSGAMVCGVTETWPITYSAKEPSIRIYALDPDHPRRVIFYHQERQLACALVIRGDEDEPIVARLQPTKTLVGRAVTPAGDPLAGAEVNVGWNDDTSREFQRQLNMTRDRVMTDEEGRFRVEGALPGVFRLSFSVDDKRYSTETKWDDVRTIASTLIPVGGSEVTLGEITVKPR